MTDNAILATAPQTIQVGDRAELSKTVSDADVRAFAELSLDRNPVHLDDDFAATTRFGQRIVHGALASGLVSAVLGTRLPGPGSIYVSQTISYKAPILIGDTITASVEVVKVRANRNLITLKTDVHKGDGTLLMTGEALILLEREGVQIIEG